MIGIQTDRIHPVLFKIGYLVSLLPILGLFSLFRSMHVKLFVGLLFAVLAICVFVKTSSIKNKVPFNKRSVLCGITLDFFVFVGYFLNAINIMPQIFVRFSIFSPVVTIVLCGLIGCVIGFFAACITGEYILNKLHIFITILKEYKLHFSILFFLYLASFVGIMLANYYFTDDLGRAVYGYEITGDFSRYTATVLSELLHTNTWLADIAPLPQFIALLIMAFAGVIILYLVFGFNKPKFWSVIALVPVGLSPYFLSCLVYRYDAPYMAASVLFSLAPLVYREKNAIKYALAVVVGVVFMCTTYQASSGLLPMVVMFVSLLMWIRKETIKEILKFVVSSASGYILGLLIFRFVLMTPIVDNYVDTKVSVSSFWNNLKSFVYLLNDDCPIIWKLLFLGVVLLFVVFVMRISKQNKILTGVITLFTVSFMFLMSFGVYLFFCSSSFEPRVFYGIGIFVSLLSIALFLDEKQYLGKICVVILSWCFVVFAFIYGNALSLQKEYIDYRIEIIAEDIDELNFSISEEKELYVIGTAGYVKAVKNTVEQYPVINRMIPVLLSDSTSWGWGSYQLREYYGFNVVHNENPVINLNEMELVKESANHSIYVNDSSIVVKVNEGK